MGFPTADGTLFPCRIAVTGFFHGDLIFVPVLLRIPREILSPTEASQCGQRSSSQPVALSGPSFVACGGGHPLKVRAPGVFSCPVGLPPLSAFFIPHFRKRFGAAFPPALLSSQQRSRPHPCLQSRKRKCYFQYVSSFSTLS